MSRTLKIWLAVVAVAVAAIVPVSTLSVLSAGASTTACGSSCTSPSNESLGTGEVLTVSGSGVSMAAANSTSTTQDWTPQQEGDVANAVAAGVVDAKLNMLYSTDTVVEYEYAPGGVPSDQCLANTTYGVGSSGVGLAQCGLTATSLWIVDASNAANGYVDLINAGYQATVSVLGGTATYYNPFAEPGVLTVSSGKVAITPLSELGGVVSHTQMWSNWSAPAQVALRQKVARAH